MDVIELSNRVFIDLVEYLRPISGFTWQRILGNTFCDWLNSAYATRSGKYQITHSIF